ncbi:MAG: SIS domain-containing protein [Candidatus Cloacimonetes bacterium]|nr:SIS domain-containing protein [Candidatus Cloacimonadota bacterium]
MIHSSLFSARELVSFLIDDEAFTSQIEKIASQIASIYESKGKLIIFGNGGSMCDAMHFAEELTGRFHNDRQALPAIAISDPGHLSCVANDYGYDSVFSRAVEAYATAGDMVIGISTSGNSANVIKAMEVATQRECFTCLLSGNQGGKLKDRCDFQIIIPSDNTARIQEVHGIVIHMLIELVESELFLTDSSLTIHDLPSC